LGVTATCVALAGSLIGFLFHNFNPARIFLGDSGSMFLGFVLAVISVRGSQKGTTVVAVLVPLLMLGVPLLDTSLAVARRFRRLQQEGRNTDHAFAYLMRNLGQIFRPDRKHIHHRLLDLGLSQRRAAGVLYGLGALFASAAFAVVFMNSHRVASMLIAVLAILMATFLVLLYFRAVRASRGALFRDETDPAATSDPVLRQSVTPGEARGS
jgi:UDP-GlcNAc:undecaprenyl-phosphate GlcNAc-1-phosphate transferase